MHDSKEILVEILKKAMIKENRSLLFYQKLAENASTQNLKNFFQSIAKEEEHHFNILNRKLLELKMKGIFLFDDPADENIEDYRKKVWKKELAKELQASSFEAAAISAAMSIEKEGSDFYRTEAQKVENEEAKKLLLWLSDWELEHFKFFKELDDILTEEIWYDNNFWPVI